MAGLVIGILVVSTVVFSPDGPAQTVEEALPSFGQDALPGRPALMSKVSLTAQFTAPANGQPSHLFVTARIAPGWHIYSIAQPKGGPVKSEISVAPSNAYQVGQFQAITPPEAKRENLFGGIMVESHQEQAAWYAPVQWAASVDPTQVTIEGSLKAQACDSSSCLPPQEHYFRAALGPGIPLPAQKTLAAAPAAPAASTPQVDLAVLTTKLVLAFLGGIILNLMPCVLPVISLKLFAFMEQAGESRGHVLALNIWYALGIMAVFMLLAALTAMFGLAWGEQFTLPWFKVALTGLVFVMALSFLGVWEIPIPGFVGGGKAGELQTREGASGAFFKGVFSTILATPCSGPLLGGLFGYLLTQPPFVSYLIYGAVGLGMASPYLVIGANPELVRFLPRPGAWMDTLKQLMGFLLLGTLVYLFSTMTAAYFIPTLTLLIGLWFACWWIGRTSLTAELPQKLAAWGIAIAVAALVGVFAFTVLLQESKIAWQTFSPDALARARAEGKTVMVDFTADWCLTCKANLKFAIDRARVRQLIDQNRVVPMIADWTDRSESIKQTLNELGFNSIPVLAIWPADATAQKPIVLSDLLLEGQVLDALKQAGPSLPSAPNPMAMRP